MSSDCPAEDILLAYVAGELAPGPRSNMVAHLASCDECRTLVSTLARASNPGFSERLTTAFANTVPSERVPAADGWSPTVGDRIDGKYQLERELGRGGMGSVWLAQHENLRQQVAIKFLQSTLRDSLEAKQRFVAEARTLAKLGSEHAVRVLDASVMPNGAPYIAMELLTGADLARLIRERGPLPIELAVDYALEAAFGLAEAHVQGIVHRDVKPSNLFVVERRDGSTIVKLLDFGIAKMMSENGLSITTTSALLGSPRYVAPEQIQDAKHVDARADVWALGATIYEMLAGAPAFDAPSAPDILSKILAAPPAPLRSIRKDVPAKLEAAVSRALAKDPNARTRNVAELAEDLSPFASDEGRVYYTRTLRLFHRESGWAPASKRRPAKRGFPLAATIALSTLLGAGLVGGVLAIRGLKGEAPHAQGIVAPSSLPTLDVPAIATQSAPPAIDSQTAAVSSAEAPSQAVTDPSSHAIATAQHRSKSHATISPPPASAPQPVAPPPPELPGMSDRK